MYLLPPIPDPRSPAAVGRSVGRSLALKVLAEALDELGLGGAVDVVGGHVGADADDAVLLLVVVDDGHAGLDKGAEALADALGVVVVAAARLAALEQAALHLRLGTVVEEHEARRADGLLELDGLVELAREAVDEELAARRRRSGGGGGCCCCCGGGGGGGGRSGRGGGRWRGIRWRGRGGHGIPHGVLEKRDGHLHGHDEPVGDVVLDQGAVLAAGAVLLGAQQVAGRQVREAVGGDETRALRALAGARTAQHEEHRHVIGREDGRLAVLEVVDGGHFSSSFVWIIIKGLGLENIDFDSFFLLIISF